MARLHFEVFAEKELARIYIAGRVSEAEGVQSALTRHGSDCAVDIEAFLTPGLGLFTLEYSGVAFYVLSGRAAFARSR